LKPKSKMSQRPKDTVKRDQSAKNAHATKLRRVEAKQLADVVAFLKLRLQEQELPSIKMQSLVFKPYHPESQVSIE